MRDQSFNFEIKDLLTQFLAAFDDIVIKRYDKDRVAKELVEVRYVLAPKQRVMYDIVNKAQNLTLPVIAVNITSISRDTNRVFNKLDNIYNKSGDRNKSAVLMPIPVNIELNMSILARYMQDMEQILSNFVPYNNPYVILSWKEPTNIAGQVTEIRSEVLWSGSISLTEPNDIAYSEKFRIVADTSFTIKGWLFRNKNDLSSQIYFIDANFIPIRNDMIVTENEYSSFFASLSEITESVNLSALPTVTNAFYNSKNNLLEITSNYTMNYTIPEGNMFVLYGTNYKYTDTVLLSSSTISSLTTTLTSVSSKYTGEVTGYVLPTSAYNILNDNMISINLNNIEGSGDFNIVVNNIVGSASTFDINGFIFTKP